MDEELQRQLTSLRRGIRINRVVGLVLATAIVGGIHNLGSKHHKVFHEQFSKYQKQK